MSAFAFSSERHVVLTTLQGSQYLVSKPRTADPSLRHSFPFMSHSASSSRTSGNNHGSRQARERQPALPWNSSTALGDSGLLSSSQSYMPGQLSHSAAGAMHRSSWSASVAIPRTGRHGPQRSSMGITSGGFMHKGGGSPVDSSFLQFSSSPSKHVWTGASEYADLAAREAAAIAVAAAATITNTGSGSFAPGVRDWRMDPSAQSALTLETFPGLAALEQQFKQQQLAAMQHQGASPSGSHITCSPVRLSCTNPVSIGYSPETSPVAVALANAALQTRSSAVATLPQSHRVSFGESNSADAASAQQKQQQEEELQQPPPVPEPKALGWAERNIWFGADTEMTQLAYKVR